MSPYGPAGFPLSLDPAFARLQAELAATRAQQQAAAAATGQAGYVRSPHPLCAGSRCQAPALTGAAEQARQLAAGLLDRIDQEREQMMTMTPGPASTPCRALWCEEGGHSFSERDPGMKLLTVQGTDESGAPVDDSRTMCGACAPRVGVRRTRPAPAVMPGQQPLPPAPAPAAWPAGYEAAPPYSVPPVGDADAAVPAPAEWQGLGQGQ